MRFLSKKTRRNNKISIFTALLTHAKNFVVSDWQKTITLFIHGRTTLISRRLQVPFFALLLVVAIGGVSVHFAFSQYDERDQQLGIKNTLLVYPGSVLNTTWSGTEHVLSPDLDEDSLYQDFSARNSAYVPLLPVIIDEVEIDTDSDSDSDNDNDNADTAPTEEPDPAGVIPADDLDAALQDGEQQTEETEGSDEVVPDNSEEVESEEESQAEESEAEPEPEPEQEDDSQEQQTETEPVTLKIATESFFTFLGTVTELFPFMNTQEETPVSPAPEEVQEVVVTEEVQEPEVTQADENPQTEADEPVPAEAGVQTQDEVSAPATSTSTEDVLDVDPVENNESTEVPTEEVPVATLPSHSITLSDFSTPELQRGEFITGMQLRMSLGASYDYEASSTAPMLQISYKTPSSSEQVGTIVIDQEISNALNGGYFLFALPEMLTTAELNDVSIEVTYSGDTENLDGLYLDAVWLEIDVERLDKQLLQERLFRDMLKRLHNPELATLLSEDKDFTREELPQFSLRYNSQRNIAIRFFRDLFGKKLAEVEEVAFVHSDVGNIGVTPQVDMTDDGLLSIQIDEDDKSRMRPGEYSVELTINEGGVLYTDSFTFQWGLLSINPDQSSYQLGDTTMISMGALSPNGNTICDADLALYVIDPEDALFRVPVTSSGLCNGNNVIDVADYSASFVPSIIGEHEMYLERIDQDGTIVAHTIDTFLVEETLPFVLERNGPSRVYPRALYPMEISVTANEAWEGTLVERVPGEFIVSETNADIKVAGENQELSWAVTLSAGETQTFSYVFDTPDISPFLYTVGQARLEGKLPESVVEEVSTTTESDVIEEVVAEPEVPVEVTEPETVPVEEEVSVPVLEPEIVPVEDVAPEVETEEEVWTEPGDLEEPTPMESVVASSATGNIAFQEHRQWQIASDATGSMIAYWVSTAAIPSGWTCLSCGSGTFYQRFPMGGATYNTTGGAATHTHSASGTVAASATVNAENNAGGFVAISSHSHTYTPTISTVSSLPAYRQMRIIQNNSAGEPASIPAGAALMFDATLPSGWVRYAALDGRYPRGENSIANAGSNIHTHTITGSTAAASGSTVNSRTGGTQVTSAANTHTHTVSSNTGSVNMEPPYVEVLFATSSAATSTPTGAIAMWSDTPPAQWLDRSSQVGDPFYNRFVKGSATYGTTGGNTTHTHTNVTGITSSAAVGTDNARTGSTGSSNTHTHSVDATNFTTNSHLPPYTTAIFGKKFGPIPMYTQLKYRIYANANANTPTDAWPTGVDDLLENEPVTPENTAVKRGDVIRLRMQLNVSNSTSTSESFKLQFASTTALCSDISTWTDVGGATSTAMWRGYNNAGVSDGATLSTSTLSGTDILGSYEETSPSVTMPNTVGTGENGEWDFVVQQNTAYEGATYCFRMVEQDGTPLFAYTEYPSVVTNEAPEPPTLSKLFDNEKVGTTTPDFEFSATDAEANDVSYQIQIDDDYTFGSTIVDRNTVTHSTQFENLATPADKDPFTNGELIRFTNTTALTNGTTYYWRVRAQDPNGSNQWGQWATIQSFTIDTSVTVSTWFQTMEEQFDANTLLGVEGVASDQAQLLVGSTTGTMYSDPIEFEEGELGTAWGEFVFADTETSSDLKYTIQYNNSGTWTDIPNTDLAGNTAGFDTSPVSLLGVDKTDYPEIRIEANFTNSGATPSLQSWSVDWDYLIETPTIAAPFASEKVATTTPTFEFTTTDPQSDDLIYQIQWSTTYAFSASTTRSSNVNAGFTNINNGGDTSPFTSGDSIQFKVQAADALTNGTTYWWRVRARDPLGANTYSFYTDPRSFTVDTSVTVSTWFQTTQSQFDTDILSGALSQGANTATVATTSDETLVAYAEGTVTTPRYREWDGTTWGTEANALDVGAAINWIVTKGSPVGNEYILATMGTDADVNVQIFTNGAWGNLQEVTTIAPNTTMRGFDVAYENLSGDGMVVTCDGDADPSYYIWNGSSWTSGGAIGLTGGNACGWVRLISDPISDEIIAITRDTTGITYEARVWSGSAWGNSTTWGSMTETANEGIAAAYEDSGNQAVVAVSNGGNANFSWRAWNGTTWSAAATVALGDDFEWGTIAADDGSDNLALCYVDEDSDIGVVRWTGAAWVAFLEQETAANSKTGRPVDCMFEIGGSRDGYIMLAYSDTTNMRSRFWNGAAWSAEATLSTLQDASTVQLRRTGVNLIQLMAYDDVNDRYDYSAWDGTSWAALQTLETNGSIGAAPFREPFMLAPRNPSVNGTVIGDPLINFYEGSGPYWQQMSWTDTESGGSTILYQLEYWDGDSWELIPNSLIANNSTGNGTSPISLTNVLPASTYDEIRPVANMTCNAGTCPLLSDWTITWAAGITVSGTAQQYDQTTNVTSGIVGVALNGVVQVGKTGTIAGGAWSIANVNAAPGDIVTVFVSGAVDAAEAVAVSTYDGVGNMSGINLYQRHLSIGSDDLATITNASLGLYDFTNTEDIFFDVNGSNDLSMCATTGCADAELFIKAGNIYQLGSGGDVITHDIEINGTLRLNGNTMRVSGSWDNNATTTSATSTVIFTATSTSESINETGAISPSFYNVTFGETSGAATWTLNTPLDVNNALTVSRGTLARGSVAITVAGNLATQANGLWTGVGTTTFDGTTATTWSDASAGIQNIGNVVIDGTTKSVTLGGNVEAQSLYIGADDTFDLSPSNYDIYVNAHWVNNNTFNARSGDVFFTSTSAGRIITAGSDNFYNVTFNGSGGVWSFTESTLGVNNNFAITAGTVTMPTATTTISGSFTNSGTFAHNNSLVYFIGSGSKNITVNGGVFINAFYDVRFTGSGSWTFTDNATTSNDFRITQGTVTLPSGTLTVVGDFLKTGGSFVHNSGNVIFITDGSHDITATNSSFNDVTFRGTGASAWYNPSWLYRVPVTIPASAIGSDLTDFPVYIDLSTLGVGFFNDVKSDGGDIRVTQSDAVTEVPIELVSIDTGTDSGELYFRGTLSSSSDTEFYIYFGNSGASLYADTDPYGTQNVWTNGYEAVYHFSESPSAGAPQYVDSTGNSNGTATNMEAGDLIAGKVGDAADVDGVNESIQTNFNQILLRSTWSAFINADGTQAACDGLMFSRGTNVSGINLAGCQDVAEIGYHWNDGAGTWGWGGGPVYPTSEWFLASLVVEPTQATAYAHTDSGVTSGSNVAAHASSTINNLDFGWDSFGVARSFNGAFDEAYLSSVVRSADWLEATYLSLASTTDFVATSSIETPVAAGIRTFTDTNVTIVDDIAIEEGQIMFPSGTLTVGGSFDNDDVVTANNGTVLFNSADTGETISLGGSSLYNMTFNSGTGGWTIVNNATTTNNTTLTTASSFTLASGQTLAVGGVFTNSVGGAATTWTGSTLSLNAGNYSLNTKANTGDAYNVLRVASNTDIKMWNSSASTYTVNASGSLYSQDHNAVDGDLYIYGNYPRTSGTEYWSYATDFDGTALGGSSRQVDVRFASGASASFINSTLNITGISSATSTIANQGSGTYVLSVAGGTTTASYYSFANLGSSGVSLLGGNEVTSLANGSFTAGIAAGTGLTVSSTTINANPGLQIFNVEFSTTTAIAATNVTQNDGTPSSYWWFRNSYGNLDGEAKDNDTGDPGSVRWDDSSLVFTVAGTVYSDDGTTPLAGGTCNGVATPVRVVVEGGATYNGTCSAVDGSFSIPGVVAIGDPTITVFLNGASGGQKAVTVTKTPTGDITNLDLYVNRVITRHQDTAAMTIADMVSYDSSDDSDILFTAATSTLSLLPNTELFIWATTTFTPGGTVTLNSGGTGTTYDGSLHVDNGATFTGSGTTTYSIGGSFRLDAGSTFVPASSTVVMTATTTGKTIAVATGGTATFDTLRFTGSGGGWNLNGNISASDEIEIVTGTVTGTGNIMLPNGSIYGNGLLSLGAGTTTIARSNTLGGTQGWTFYNLYLGNGSVVGTTTPASTATTTIGGRLTIATAHFLDAGAANFNLSGSGTVFVENGNFLQDTSTVRYSGGSAASILSTTYYNLDLNAGAGTPTYTAAGLGIAVSNNLTIGGANTTVVNFDTNDSALDVNGNVTIASNGTLVGSNSGVFTVAGSWDNNGTFTGSGGTVTFDGSGTPTIAAGSSSFANVTLNGSGAFTVSEHATTSAAFNITAVGSFTLASGQTLSVGGVFTNAVGGVATTWTGSTLRLISGTNYQINAKTINDAYATLVVGANTDIRMWNSSAASYDVHASGSLYSQDHNAVDGDLYVYGNYVGNGGTDYWSYATDFDGAGSGGRQVDVHFASGASMALTSGGLQVLGTASASTTLQNQGSGTYGLLIGGTASTSWSYYDVEDTNSSGLTFSGAPTVVTLSRGDLEVSQGGGSAITVGGTVLNANPAKTFTHNNFSTTTGITGFNVTATGTSVSSWRFTNHTGTIDGEAYDVDPNGDPGYVVWDDSSANITISGNVYSDEGSTVSAVCDGSTNNILVRVAGLTTYTSSCNAGTGLFSVSGVTYSPGDSIIAYIDGETEKGAAVTKDPISNISNMHIYENRVIVRHENTDPIEIADMAVWDSSDDADIPFTAINSSPDTLTLPANRKLLVWTAKEFEPNGNVTVSGGGAGAAHDGTFEAQTNAIVTFTGAQTHSVGGSFILNAGASFDAGLSTTTFTTSGASRTIDINDGSFYNVAFTGSGSWTVADSILDVQSLTKTNGALTFPTGTTTVSGSFSNTGGTFTINGSTVVFDATTAGKVVRAGGSNFEELIFSGTGGSWSMTDTNATSTGSVTVQAGTVSLPSGIFAVGGDFRNEGGTLTHNTSEIILTNATSASLLASGSDLYAVAFKGAGSFAMEDQSLALLDDLRILQGSVTFATGTLSIGGSFTATGGTFNNATGTILFNSTDAGETVNPGTSPFYNVVFGNAAGGWTVSSATTTNNLTISTAASYTQTSGTRLYVGNVFTNSVGGAATTWTGSTLVLDSGSPYSINTKTTGGDQYATLTIGANTDIKAWNSSATTPNISASGSFYSQDHAAANGALYIYGDFHVSTTTEYWSYATDFDGTSLGGSPRAVTVSIASNATTTVDGGALNIIGASGNSTTITNQGSGTYAFKVNDGTFNGLYYAYRNLNAAGLHFTQAPTITSLSQGDFELAVNGGSLITLASSSLNANASMLFTGNRFATTSAITGTNVELVGTTSNAWTFTTYTGNLGGENFDDDGITACGSIRWNNSSCLLTQQTHYRWRHDDGGIDVPNSEWFNGAWDARKSVRLQNPDATTYSNAVVKLEVAYDADMQTDFEDLRFTDSSGTATIPHFIERYTASTDAEVWVEVPSLAGEDITNIYMYFDNPTATSTSSSGNTFIAADDFEDGNISEYSGDTGLFTVDGSFAYGGSYGLDTTGDEGSRATDGIGRNDITVSQNQIIRYLQYVDVGSGDEVCTLFGVQSPVTSNLNYAVCLEQVGTDRISLARDVNDVDSSGIILASTTVDYVTEGAGWYEVEIDWQTNDDIDVTLSKDGSLIASISDNDGTYTSGGIGFTYWFQHGGWDNYTSRVRVETEPTVYFGDKQGDGGASWAASLDDNASYVSGDVARLRLAIENSGLQITGQTFDLEFAEKGAAPSCEAVSDVNYSIVPPQASCGSSALCMQSSANITDGAPTTDLLFGTEGQFVAGEVVEDPSNTTASMTIEQNEYTELEYAITPTINANEPSYCLRVTDGGNPVDTYLSVAELTLRFDPVVTNVSLNSGADISLVPGTTTTVYATGTVTDLNGYADLVNATSTIYRSAVSGGAACTGNNNDCYISTAPLCSFYGCAGNSCEISCSADIFFHADATDADPYEGEEWVASIEVRDQAGSIDIGDVPLNGGVEVFSLPALDVTSSISYGSLAVSSTTGSYNPTTTVQNLGNIPIDIQLEGTDLTDGGSSFIPTSEQIFSTSTFTYTGCTGCSALSSTTPVDLEVDLSKPTSVGSPVTDVVYWGIEIPFGVASNPHSGTNTFYAVSDSL